MLLQLTNLPDVSRFLDELKINNTVNLLIGEDTIQVNGIVISLVSKVLQDLAVKGTDLYLDEFVGDVDGVRDCVRFLYGGRVDITSDNINTIVKFSIRFEVECLYQVCVQWIEANLRPDNLYLCINVGIMVEGKREGKSEILTACTRYIKNIVADDFVVVSEHWSLDNAALPLIRFLAQAVLLPFTLPTFTKIQDKHIDTMVNQVEILANGKGAAQLTLSKYKKEFIQLLKLLSDEAENLEMCKKIKELSCRIVNVKEDVSLVSLVVKNSEYITLSVNDLIKTEEEYRLGHFQYAEIVVHWITHNHPSQADLDKVWLTIRHQELYFNYVLCMHDAIVSLPVPVGSFYFLPWFDDKGEDYYQNKYRFNIRIKRNNLNEWDLDPAQFNSLLNINQKPLTIQFRCKKCLSSVTANFRLRDAVPCFWSKVHDSQHRVKHCFFTLPNADNVNGTNYSLITNSYDSVITMLKEPSIIGARLIGVYECDNLYQFRNKRSKTDSH